MDQHDIWKTDQLKKSAAYTDEENMYLSQVWKYVSLQASKRQPSAQYLK